MLRVTGPKVGVASWLFVCALACGVIGMHHLGLASQHGDEHAAPVAMAGPVMAEAGCCGDHASAPGHDPGPTGPLQLLHLCLAVLAGAVVLGALLIQWRQLVRERGAPARLSQVLRRYPPRAPPDSATVLASLGVLRL